MNNSLFSSSSNNAEANGQNGQKKEEPIKLDAKLTTDGNFLQILPHKDTKEEAEAKLASYNTYSQSSPSYYEQRRRNDERSYKWKEIVKANLGRMNFTDYDTMLYPVVPGYEAFARASIIDSTNSKVLSHKYEIVREEIPTENLVKSIMDHVATRLSCEDYISKLVKSDLKKEAEDIEIPPALDETIMKLVADMKGALIGYTKLRTKDIKTYRTKKVDHPEVQEVPHISFTFFSEPYNVEIHMEGEVAALFSLLLPAIERIRSRYRMIKKYRNSPLEEIDYDYETKGKYEPMDHQKRMYKIHMLMDKSFDGSDMGVGKSYSALMVMDTRLKLEQVRKGRILMIVPNNTIENWIKGEMATHAPHLKAKVIDGHYNERVTTILGRDNADYDIYVTNFETFSMNQNVKLGGKTIKLPLASIFSLVPWDMVLIDEVHRIKNPESKRAQNIIKHFDDVTYKMIMSGTINANKLWDVHFPFYFLDGARHFNSLNSDRSNSVLLSASTMSENFKSAYFNSRDGSPYKFTVEELRKRMEEFSVRFEKSECLDLPEKVYEQRLIDMDPQQKELYIALKNFLSADLGEKIDKGGSVTIFGIFAMMTKLAEAANGWIYDDNHNLINLPFNPKLDALMDVLDDLNENDKCVIWSRFTNDLHLVYDRIKEKYGDGSVAVMHGTDHCPICDARKDMRYTNQLNFNDLSNPLRFLISNQAVGSEGVNYTGATFEVFYSNSFVKTHRSQGENRCHRKGMRDNLTIIDLVMKDTVDVDVLMALKSWKSISRALLGHLGVNPDKVFSKSGEKEEGEAPVIVEHIAQKPGECALTTIAMLTGKAIDYIRAWVTVKLGDKVKYSGTLPQIMQVVEHFLPEMKDQWENYTKRHDEEMVSLEEKELPQTGSGAAIIRHNKSKRIAHAIAYDKGMVFDLGRRGKISINDYMNWMAVNNYSVDYVFRIHAGMNLQINLDELNNQTDRTEKES